MKASQTTRSYLKFCLLHICSRSKGQIGHKAQTESPWDREVLHLKGRVGTELLINKSVTGADHSEPNPPYLMIKYSY